MIGSDRRWRNCQGFYKLSALMLLPWIVHVISQHSQGIMFSTYRIGTVTGEEHNMRLPNRGVPDARAASNTRDQTNMDPLRFWDVRSLSEIERRAAADACDEVVLGLFQRLGYQWPVPSEQQKTDNALVFSKIEEWADRELKSCDLDAKTVKRLVDFGVACGCMFYPHGSVEIKFLMSQMTVLATALDDKPNHHDIVHHTERYLSHDYGENDAATPAKTLLRLYAEGVNEMAAYFEADDGLTASLIRASLETYLLGWLLEARVHGMRVASDNDGPQASPTFADWVRGKSGIGDAYVLAIFKPNKETKIGMDRWLSCVTDLQCYTGYFNDVMSLRKEILEGDAGNYMNIKTRIRHLSGEQGTTRADKKFCIRDMLNETVAEVEQAAKRIDALIKHAIPEKLHLWHGYRHGYILWHLSMPRYQLENVARDLRGVE
ncbi:hypothetical protein IE81DRAFT_348356 [Ceraceosorus guamensis]|uniref:Terpenoid synthase n=1 Tax=Ceraceosorus guamensis TaxID=1522189 RepID=A0A316VVD7_9BASI|nr:hypothetical protein IE81DRAFT_348356 [Ceraceosorus guamensis]PWN41419.1 hypothetical protein IE81DRAFT_348356 [Ceraceosorus guamensis]